MSLLLHIAMFSRQRDIYRILLIRFISNLLISFAHIIDLILDEQMGHDDEHAINTDIEICDASGSALTVV